MPKFSNKSFAKTLLKLPVEIAQQILGYVPFYRVLVIAVCLEGTYLREPFEDLVLSLRFQKIFSADDGTLMCMIDLYKIYLELLQFIKQYTRLPNLYKLTLSMGFDELWPHDVPYLKTIRRRQYDELSYEVRHMLQSLRWSESFQPFVELPRHRDFLLLDCYKEYWRAVRDKHSQFAARRYSQLQTLAGIFRKYHTFLKKSSDPGLDARPNYTHILNRLERCAEQYQKDVLKPRSRRHSSLYHHHHLPILPLDKYLLLFVHTLAQYPYQCSCSFPEVKNHGIVGLSINSENAPQSLIYPSHIQEEISRVIHGLKEVYTSEAVVSGCLPSKYVVIRTKFTPYSGVRLSKLPTISACRFPVTVAHHLPNPVFTVPPWPHLKWREGYGYLTANRHKYQEMGKITWRTWWWKKGDRSVFDAEGRRLSRLEVDEWDEREIQWLESFLRCVKWMEDQGLRVNEEKTTTDGETTQSSR